MLEYHHLLAGITGGVVSTIAVHPLDLLKIRYQVNEGNKAIRPQYNGYWHCAKEIVKQRGFAGLYQGVTPNLWGAAMSWGLYMMFYNAIKDLMAKDHRGGRRPDQHLLAGVLAGSATLALANPIWVVKTRLCVQYEGHTQKYRGFFHALKVTYVEEGIRGWYKGFLPGLIGTSHGALQFMGYEELKKLYCITHGYPLDHQLNSHLYFTFAALSKIFAASATYPYQVVRSRLQDHHVKYEGVKDVIVKTLRMEGWRGFYKGMFASLLRVTPANAINLAVYEEVRHLLKPPSAVTVKL